MPELELGGQGGRPPWLIPAVVVAGGLGLVFFLSRQGGAAPRDPTSASTNVGIASLQDLVKQLQGDSSKSFVSLADQLKGLEGLGTKIDQLNASQSTFGEMYASGIDYLAALDIQNAYQIVEGMPGDATKAKSRKARLIRYFGQQGLGTVTPYTGAQGGQRQRYDFTDAKLKAAEKAWRDNQLASTLDVGPGDGSQLRYTQ